MVFADRNDVMIPCFFLKQMQFLKNDETIFVDSSINFHPFYLSFQPDIIFNTSRVF